MVSLQSVSSFLAATTPAKKKKKKKEIPAASVLVENSLSRRRKYQENEEDDDNFFLMKKPKVAGFDATGIEIGLEAASGDPLPLEWQQCLDIKSGEIHFYNTMTNKRTFQDPRAKRLLAGGGAPPCLSLDLKLNLASSEAAAPAKNTRQQRHLEDKVQDGFKYFSSRSSSWISVDADQVEEMVAAVCIRCHMLVMMCKATPSCPNCKFVQSPPPSPRLI